VTFIPPKVGAMDNSAEVKPFIAQIRVKIKLVPYPQWPERGFNKLWWLVQTADERWLRVEGNFDGSPPAVGQELVLYEQYVYARV
jgi:hypothetical protein